MRLGLPEPSTGQDGRRRRYPKLLETLTRRYRREPTQAEADTADQRSFLTMRINLGSDIMPAGLELAS